jgi:hypothetical protein
MMILACDPGPTSSALVWYDSTQRRIADYCDEPNESILQRVKVWQGKFVIEKIACMGMAVGAEVFETVFWSGRFCQASFGFDRVTRAEVKMHLCGSMRAKDSNIRQALIDKLGPQGTKKNPGPTYGISKHLWSALAVAVTYAETKI